MTTGLLRATKRGLVRSLARLDEGKYKRCSYWHLLIGGYDRVYFYHIRKTGGSSHNHAFLALGDEPSDEVKKGWTTQS